MDGEIYYITVFILLSMLYYLFSGVHTVFENNFTVLVRTLAWMDSATKNAHMHEKNHQV